MYDPVLIVEDEPNIRELLKDIISFKGFDAVTAQDGYEAILAIEKQKFHLVFLDLRLPGISGLEVLKKIKERASITPVIIVTGNPEDLKHLESGVILTETVIPKPFKLRQITEALAKIGERK